MGTRSVIGYETEEGGYIGVYCHFDGYTSNVLPQLGSMTWEEVVSEVNRALYESAAARGLYDCQFECYQEPPDPESWGYFEWPCHEQQYNYRKRRDGIVEVLA